MVFKSIKTCYDFTVFSIKFLFREESFLCIIGIIILIIKAWQKKNYAFQIEKETKQHFAGCVNFCEQSRSLFESYLFY